MIKSTNLERHIPDLSNMDEKSQREIRLALDRIQEIHQLSLKELREEFHGKLNAVEKNATDLVNGFATNLIGDTSNNPLQTLQETTPITVDDLPSIPTTKITGTFGKSSIPPDTVYSNFTQVVTGDLPITGTLKIKDKDGVEYVIPYI